MVTESERQAIVDEEHLRLLPVAYWVLGATDIFASLYGFMYVAMGVFFALIPWESSSSSPEPSPAFMGWFFVAFGAAFILGFGTLAVLKILTGFWIRRRKHRVLCLIVAGLSCMFVPFGTIVGVSTFLVLLRPSVASLFASTAMAEAQSAGVEPEDGEDHP